MHEGSLVIGSQNDGYQPDEILINNTTHGVLVYRKESTDVEAA